jgi:hypothetical protein
MLGAALLAVTAFVRVPTELLAGSAQDLAFAARDVLLVVFGAGLVLFAALALVVWCVPVRLRRVSDATLVALAVYAWVRSGFFPGPSVSLDGSRLRVDLSTGAAGLLVPLVAAALAAWLGTRHRRALTTFLAVLLGASLVQSLGLAASSWRASPPPSGEAARSVLEWSRAGNVLILILDSLQSDVFQDVLAAQPDLRKQLDGFSYYRHASSAAPTTYLSLPTIHSGSYYAPGESVGRFYEEAVKEGSVLNRLAGAGYQVSYALGVGGCPRAVPSCLSTAALAQSRLAAAVEDASLLLDLGIYRVLPDRFREELLRHGRGPLSVLRRKPHLVGRIEAAARALGRLGSSVTVTSSPPTAKMIHSMITHRPSVLQPDCSAGERRDDRDGARRQAQCAFGKIIALLDQLKLQGLYDVSSIVVLADHGYDYGSRYARSRDPKFRKMVGALNPVLLVKPAAARGELVTSDAPVELADVARALCSEAGCAPAEGLRRLEGADPGRTRTAFWYTWKHRYWGLAHIPGLVRYAIRGDLTRVESWSREGAPYTPGTVIDFRRGQNLGRYVGFGWGHPRPSCTWMADAEATLWLRGSFEPTRDYELVLAQRLSDAAAAARQRVSIEINGVRVGDVSPSEATGRFESCRLLVPGSVLSRSVDTVIRFSSESAARTPHSDAGEPGFALQTLVLRPLP